MPAQSTAYKTCKAVWCSNAVAEGHEICSTCFFLRGALAATVVYGLSSMAAARMGL